MAKRGYTLKKRADSQEETRRRIVEATVALHEEVGPRATTISAIAERAGVQRLTVYRHFPDDEAVFRACSSHWGALNPPPDPAAWAGIADPLARVEAALGALYPYYRRNRRMLSTLVRDEPHVPAMRGPMEDMRGQIAAVADGLLAGWREASEARAATLGHALAFSTWESLADQGMTDDAMAALVRRWVAAA